MKVKWNLFLFNSLCDLGRGVLVCSEETDDAGSLGVQNIPISISDHHIQLQDPKHRESAQNR